MGPSRPAVHGDQWPLLAVTLVALVGSVVFVLTVVLDG